MEDSWLSHAPVLLPFFPGCNLPYRTQIQPRHRCSTERIGTVVVVLLAVAAQVLQEGCALFALTVTDNEGAL